MEKTKEVGIIGQMYEDRKTKKVGVLESRDEKFKTLLMRDVDGKQFNINFSTFRSNWRKYQGDEVIQTSTQVEEQRAEQAEAVETATKEVAKKSDRPRLSTEEKIKKLRALDTLVTDMIKQKESNLRVSRKSKGAIVVSYKKTALFEIWERFSTDMMDFAIKEDIVALNRGDFDKIINETEYTYLEKWVMKHRCRVGLDAFSDALSDVLNLAIQYENMRIETDGNKKEKKSANADEEE